MFSHEDIWVAIDALAKRHGYSTSGLAKKAGLDPTALNRSKRQSPEGKPRWPSTESISKILSVTQSDMQEFILLIEQHTPEHSPYDIPVIPLDGRLSGRDFDSMGIPKGGRWSLISTQGSHSALQTSHCYALNVTSKDFDPVYRQDSLLVATPEMPARTGDRILLCDRSGGIHMARLLRPKQNHVVMRPLVKDTAYQIAIEDVSWMARIIWASQ